MGCDLELVGVDLPNPVSMFSLVFSGRWINHWNRACLPTLTMGEACSSSYCVKQMALLRQFSTTGAIDGTIAAYFSARSEADKHSCWIYIPAPARMRWRWSWDAGEAGFYDAVSPASITGRISSYARDVLAEGSLSDDVC
jgi:hypothetical protein